MEKTFRKQEEMYPRKVYAHQIVTIDDLQQFKKQLVDELLTALKSQTGAMPKKWMKSHEVRRLLKISPGPLQTLKSSGVMPFTKIGGVHFYDYVEIQNILESGKVNNKQE